MTPTLTSLGVSSGSVAGMMVVVTGTGDGQLGGWRWGHCFCQVNVLERVAVVEVVFGMQS